MAHNIVMLKQNNNKKIVVIGGGPGGYVAAIRAAQLGAEVVLVEKEQVGGTCLNVGCIPTKSLLHSAEVYNELVEADTFGIEIEGKISFNWSKVQSRKTDVINQLVGGVQGLLKHNKVQLIQGRAKLESKNSVIIEKVDRTMEKIQCDNIIIASGSSPFIPPIPGVDLEGVIDSTGALNIEKLPNSLTIVGGGVIGIEFAYLFSAFGCKVTVVEMMPEILPRIDKEVVAILKEKLTQNKVDIYTKAKVTQISKGAKGLVTFVETERGTIEVSSEKVLVAIGRRANMADLNLEAVGIRTEKNGICVNNRLETNIEGIYAIGDVTGINMLAHVASDQGTVAVENIMGKNVEMDYRTVPSCIYSTPEIASVGLTEEEAKNKDIDYKVGKFPLSANGKALVMNEVQGFIKIIADKKYGEVLGVHMIGPRATDLITEGALAVRLEATVDELITTIHAHPTVGEAVREAALAVNKEAIHFPN